MTVQYTDAELLYQCDLYYPPTGIIRYVALLTSALQLNLVITANATSNTITFATAQPFKLGARLRVFSTVTLPTPLAAGVDYFAIPVTTTTFKLAASITDAIAGTSITLIDAGSGVLTASEQPLLRTDPIAVLLSKEFASFPAYTARFPINNVGSAAIILAKAQKTQLIVLSNSGPVDISIGYYLIIRGGIATIGDATTLGYGLEILANPLVITVGGTNGLNLVMRGA